MKSFSGKASLMATLVAALVGASSAQAAEIKIGVVLPLSGALSGYGQPSQKGLDIIQAITPTLKNGDTIKLIVIDDKSDKVEAANAMQRLVSSDKVDAVIGEVTSSNTLAMTKIADDSKTAGLLHRHQRPRHPQPSLRQPGLLLGQLPGGGRGQSGLPRSESQNRRHRV
jgi:branched-chain amino acid transport system substrate-binding protein